MFKNSKYFAFDDENGVYKLKLRDPAICSPVEFDELWKLHPKSFPTIFIHGRQVALPRWQLAYGMDYQFSNQLSSALPVPTILIPYLTWARNEIDSRLNGMLLNWYDANLNHYIGAHRDSIKNLVPSSHIVMISLGATRITRFRPMKLQSTQGLKKYHDIEVNHGDAIIMSLDVNNQYKHEVPKLKSYQGTRISITLRCFQRPD